MRGTIFFRWILSGVIGVALFLLPQAITYAEESGKIVIFHAGSLTIPLVWMCFGRQPGAKNVLEKSPT